MQIIVNYSDILFSNLYIFTQSTQWLSAFLPVYLYHAVYLVVICFKLHILPMTILPFLHLCSKPSGFLHLLSCACISLLPKPHSMPKTYMRLSPSSSLPSGYLLTYKHMCGVVAPDICPNCTLYPVVTTPLPETLKLLSTFLCYCRIRELVSTL